MTVTVVGQLFFQPWVWRALLSCQKWDRAQQLQWRLGLVKQQPKVEKVQMATAVWPQ